MFRGPRTGAAHAAAACGGWIGGVIWLVGSKKRVSNIFQCSSIVKPWYHSIYVSGIFGNRFQTTKFCAFGIRP